MNLWWNPKSGEITIFAEIVCFFGFNPRSALENFYTFLPKKYLITTEWLCLKFIPRNISWYPWFFCNIISIYIYIYIYHKSMVLLSPKNFSFGFIPHLHFHPFPRKVPSPHPPRAMFAMMRSMAGGSSASRPWRPSSSNCTCALEVSRTVVSSKQMVLAAKIT